MLDTIYVCRHGFRMNWVGAEVFQPTGRPRDPVLTAHGMQQARSLATYLESLPANQRPELIVSSPYYRCLQTSEPIAERLGVELVAEPGLAEWFTTTSPGTGVHPSPASAAYMKKHISALSLSWSPLLYPDPRGESVAQLHARTRRVLALIEARCEQLGIQRILLCSHAATIIAIGRTLLHDDHNAQRSPRIGAGTASLSKYLRQPNAPWLQQLNGDASFLPSGVEREWQFDMVPDNATEPGMGPDWSDPEHPTKAKHSHFSFHPQKLFNKL